MDESTLRSAVETMFENMFTNRKPTGKQIDTFVQVIPDDGEPMAPELTLGEILLSAFTEDSRQENSAEDIEEFSHIIGKFVQVRVVEMIPFKDDGTKGITHYEGSHEHQCLCATAAQYLDSKGIKWSDGAVDLWCPGGKADLISLDRKLVVEAGCTRLSKIYDCFREGMEVLIVPFAGGGEVGFILSRKHDHDAIREWKEHQFARVSKHIDEVITKSNDRATVARKPTCKPTPHIRRFKDHCGNVISIEPHKQKRQRRTYRVSIRCYDPVNSEPREMALSHRNVRLLCKLLETTLWETQQ